VEVPLDGGTNAARCRRCSSTIVKNTPSCSVQQRIKHTEELGETLQDGTKALGYKVTWLRMKTSAASCATFKYVPHALVHTCTWPFKLSSAHHPCSQRLWKYARRWDVHTQARLQVWVVDATPDGGLSNFGAADNQNFRFNAGSTLFRIRVLSAISLGET